MAKTSLKLSEIADVIIEVELRDGTLKTFDPFVVLDKFDLEVKNLEKDAIVDIVALFKKITGVDFETTGKALAFKTACSELLQNDEVKKNCGVQLSLPTTSPVSPNLTLKK